MNGLVFEGGGLRGCFTAGVIDVFLEKGITFDTLTGISAGACNACSYLAGQHGRAVVVGRDYVDNPDYCSMRNLIKTGNMFGEQFVFHDIPEKIYPVDNEAFKQNPTEFFVGVTDCLTGKAHYRQIRDLIEDVEWIRASCALPFVSKFVEIDGVPYLDGGIADAIPIDFSIAHGCDKNIIVLTRARDYRKKADSTYPAMKVLYRKYPELLKVLKDRHTRYNDTLDYIFRLEEEGRAIVLAPEVTLAIGRTEKNKEKLTVGYKLGRKAALTQIDKIKEFLA